MCRYGSMNEETELERRAGKGPDLAHPDQDGGPTDPDPSDYADPRVAQPGDEPPTEDALHDSDREPAGG